MDDGYDDDDDDGTGFLSSQILVLILTVAIPPLVTYADGTLTLLL